MYSGKEESGNSAQEHPVRGKRGSKKTQQDGLTLSGSNELFRVLIENLNEIVFTMDVDGRFTYISPVIERVSGYLPDELIGLFFSEVVLSEDLPVVVNILEQILDGAENLSVEFRMSRKDGTFWYANASTRILVVEGQVKGFSGVITDITEQKLAEEALRKSEQEKLAILDAIPDLIFRIDRDGVFLDYKAEKVESLFLPSEKFLGKKLRDVLPVWLADLTLAHLKVTLETGKMQFYEYSLPLGGGDHFFEARMLAYRQDQALVIIRDQTEQRNAEQVRFQAEEKYRTIVEQIPAVVYTDAVDECSTTLFISPQIEKMTGYTAAQWISDPLLWLKIMHPDDRLVVEQEHKRTNQTGDVFQMEYRVITTDGREIWIRDESALLHDTSGAPLCWQGVLLDITEQKNSEQARQQAEQELRESEERYRMMVEHSPEAIVIHSDGLLVYVNQSALRLIGARKPEEVLGRGVMDFVHPDSRDLVLHRIRESLDKHKPLQPAQEKFVRLDGKVIDVEVSNIPFTYNGRTAIQVMLRDVTKQKQVEEERRLSARRLETLLQLSQMDSASLTELNDFAMEQALQFTGSPIGYIAFLNENETVITMHSCSCVVPKKSKIKDKEYVYSTKDFWICAEAVQQRKPIIANDFAVVSCAEPGLPESDLELTRHMIVPIFDGEHIVIVAGVANKPDDYNNADVKQLTLLMDEVWRIIRQKQAEAALRTSEESYRGLFDSVSEAIYIQDRDGRFLDVNQGAVDMYGYPREYFIGKTPDAISAPQKNDNDKLALLLARAFAGEPQWFEFWGQRKNGEAFPKEVRLYKGTYFGRDVIFALARDVTERKRSEDALRRRDAILEAVGLASEQFLKAPDWTQSMDVVLSRLGQAADASRVYIFDNFYDSHGDLLLRQRFEWCAEGIAPQLDNTQLQHLSYRDAGFLRWQKNLAEDRVITGNVAAFPQSEKDVLLPQDIISILVMPIFVGTHWWGFIGFDECRTEREWHPNEVEALRAAASLLGAAIQTTEAEKVRLQHLQELEVIHSVSLACMRAVIADEVIENVTRIIRDAFHLESFGVLLFNSEHNQLALHASYHGNFDKNAFVNIPIGKGVPGYVAKTRSAYRVADTAKEKLYLEIAPGMRSEVCAPMLLGKTLMGVLVAESPLPNYFTSDHERLLSTIAATMATTIEKLRLFEAEYSHRQEAERLRDASTALTSSLELQPLLENILGSLVKIVPHDSASIVLREENGLRIVAARSIPEEIQYVGRLFSINKKWEKIIETRRPLILEDAQKSSSFEKWAGSDYIRGWMGVPLLVRGELIGCLCLDSRKPNAFTREHAALVQTYANHAASAIENAHLFAAEREQRYRQGAMLDLMRVAASSLDLETVLENTLSYLLRLVPGKTGSIQLLEGNTLKIAAVIGFKEEEAHRGICFPLVDYPLNREIIQEKHSICLSDTWQDNRYIRLPYLDRICSFLGVPLIFKEDVIGIITIDSDRENGFTERDEELASAVARNISVAIENARLFESERTRRLEAETLRQAAAVVSSSLDLDRVLDAILVSLNEVVPYDSASVILEQNNGDLEVVAERGLPKTLQVVEKKLEKTGIWQQMVTTRMPVILADAQLDPLFEKKAITEYIRGWMGIPLIARDKVIGEISIDNCKPNAYTEETALLAQAFAHQAAIAVENARLYQQALVAAERWVVLHQASEEIARSSQDPERVYLTVHQAAKRLMPAEAFVISLADETRNEVYSAYLYDKDGRWPPLYSPMDSGISGQIINSGQPLIIRDLDVQPIRNAVHFGNKDEVRSALAVPMRLGDKVIGMLSAQSYQPNMYTEEDQRLLEMLAAHAAVAIENARLFDQTQRRRVEAEALSEATAALTSSLDIDQVTHHLLDALAQVISYDSATVFLRENGSLVGVVARGLPSPEKVIGQKFPATDVLFQTIVETCQPLIIQDVQTDERFQRFGETAYVHGWMGVPLIIRDEVIGIMTIDNRLPGAYTGGHGQLAFAFANQAATAVDKARLFAETLHRLSDLEVINRVSTQLRAAGKVGEMLPTLLDEVLKALTTDAGSIWLYDPASGFLKTPLARGWFIQLGETPISPGEGIAGQVFSTGKPIISKEFVADPTARERMRNHIPPGWGGACVPIRSGQETIGVMFIGTRLSREIRASELHLLTTLCEIAGNAIRRADLHEQTERQLQRLASLRTIDMAISTILDLRVTLGILIDHIIFQLKVDAVNVLLINPNTQTLYHAASSGFRTDAVKNAQIYTNDGLALQVIRSRATVFVPELSGSSPFPRQQILTSEGFVTYFGVPLIAKGQVKGILETFHRHTEDPNIDWRGFLETLAGQAAIAIDNSLLFEELQQTNLNLSLAYDATIEGWSKALDLRDRETEGHTLRVTKTTLDLAEAMGTSVNDLIHIRRGALLHDIGKMGVPDSILHKAGPLTEDEWAIMHRHPEFAYAMLSPIAYLRPALDVPYCHHERWDGSGYPRGLQADQIPLAARMFAVVDVYDALTSTRPYRAGWTHKEAVDFIRKNAGILFDPKVVETFLQMLSKKGTGR